MVNSQWLRRKIMAMIKLYEASTGKHLGDITEAQFQSMRDQLEEEAAADQDYYINQTTVDLFEERGVDPALVTLLRQALGTREEMDIRWEQT
jgi:processive 1,2-diacylglycerol beta-glucosyltransferase